MNLTTVLFAARHAIATTSAPAPRAVTTTSSGSINGIQGQGKYSDIASAKQAQFG